MLNFKKFLILFLNNLLLISTSNINPTEVKCHVCKATVHEIEFAIGQEDPNKIIEVSGFRIDSNGNSVSKTVQLIKSETYLTELMENICDKLDDYAKATHKKTGKLNVLKMIGNDGNMNPEMGLYDFIQDGDLNKSLKHYCLQILDDHDEAFVNYFTEEILDNEIDIKICSDAAKYCHDQPVQDDYKLEDEL